MALFYNLGDENREYVQTTALKYIFVCLFVYIHLLFKDESEGNSG